MLWKSDYVCCHFGSVEVQALILQRLKENATGVSCVACCDIDTGLSAQGISVTTPRHAYAAQRHDSEDRGVSGCRGVLLTAGLLFVYVILFPSFHCCFASTVVTNRLSGSAASALA